MQIKFGWIGWNQDDGSDKIWGWLHQSQYAHDAKTAFIFWGRRGKTLSFKTCANDYDLIKLVDSKNRKGYVRINESEFKDLWPDFYEMCEQKLTWHILSS